MNAAESTYYLVLGFIMIGFGILDIWIFAYFPLQKNIFIDKKENLPYHSLNLSNRATFTTANRSMLQVSKQSMHGQDGIPEVMNMNQSVASYHVKDN